MQITGNTIFITGGGSGIGRGLAEAFQARGNQVIIAGRRQSALDETVAANPGMASLAFDIDDPASIKACAARLIAEHPKLNVLINNAGIMRQEKLQAQQADLADAEATVITNLLGPIRLTAALLPQLLKQPQATVMTVTSGLAYVPLALTPTYCATKAGIHSYSQSMRYQLKDTAVRVLELVPPYVQTELTPNQANDPHAMPLRDFIDETMRIIETSPDAEEICVENVKAFRFAEANGAHQNIFNHFNEIAAATGH